MLLTMMWATISLSPVTATPHRAYPVFSSSSSNSIQNNHFSKNEQALSKQPQQRLRTGKKRERDLSSFSPQSRVVGGTTVTDLDKHPFFAEWHDQFCGGAVRCVSCVVCKDRLNVTGTTVHTSHSCPYLTTLPPTFHQQLIHDDLVLTASHCYNGRILHEDIYFRNVKRKDAETSVHRTIAAFERHPRYNMEYSTREWDYLILKLDKSALVDDDGNPTGVKTIPLNRNASIPQAGDKLWGIGYGQLGEDIEGMSPTLQEVSIAAYSNATCEKQYTKFFEQDYMFCSGNPDGYGGKDTCQGDSGGPIVHQESGMLVGLVSFGIGCARREFAGVNSRVSAAIDWLDDAKCRYSNYPACGTTAPATQAPALSTESASRRGSGSLTVSIVLDDYPEELSWIMQSKNGNETLHFQPFQSYTTARATISRTFDNLQAGETYMFKVADLEGDGSCCAFGNGQIIIQDNVQEIAVFSAQGNFGRYYEVDLEIQASTGHAEVIGRSGNYTPSTWSQYEEMIAPDNADWPGAFPLADAFSVVVNVQTDDYPDENSWELKQYDSGTGQWLMVDQWDGAASTTRTLDSVEIANLRPGSYHFLIRDSGSDGNCCNYGSGFVSLTGPLAIQQGEKGFLWGNDGKFWALDEIFFEVDISGFITYINFHGINL